MHTDEINHTNAQLVNLCEWYDQLDRYLRRPPVPRQDRIKIKRVLKSLDLRIAILQRRLLRLCPAGPEVQMMAERDKKYAHITSPEPVRFLEITDQPTKA